MRLLPIVAVALTAGGCVIDELRDDDVGDAPVCDAAERWPRVFAEREDVLIFLVEELRERGGECNKVRRNPVPALVHVPELRCAARIHAAQLSARGVLQHNVGSTTPAIRASLAGYEGIPKHELLAGDFQDAELVLEAWLAEQDPCLALYDNLVDDFGVGYAENPDGDATAWVLVIGEERE